MPRLSTILAVLAMPLPVAASEFGDHLEFRSKIEFGYAEVKSQPTGLKPWWQKGTGQLAQATDGWVTGPVLAALNLHNDSNFSVQVHGQWHAQPTHEFGVTEAWLNWTPLPMAGYKLKTRAGWFYPALSLENTDVAWSSPYSSNFSAVNSWIAEELRSQTIEVSLSRPGRSFSSDHSFSWVGAIFRGNDPLGAIISWRGFAIHNFQTNLNERVEFAKYPSLQQGSLAKQPSWVEPFVELDDRYGYYAGVHWMWQNQTEVRFYHYDNQADPLVLAKGQYAWRTQFQQLALQQQINANWRIISQWLSGDTAMGPDAISMDFNAWYILANYQADTWQLSLRYDHFKQIDRDLNKIDDNNGRGHGWTLSLQYPLSAQIALQLEWTVLNTHQANRAQWQGWPVQQQFAQTQLSLIWRLD